MNKSKLTNKILMTLLANQGRGILVLDEKFNIVFFNIVFSDKIKQRYNIQLEENKSALSLFKSAPRFLEVISILLPRIARQEVASLKLKLEGEILRIEGFSISEKNGKVEAIALFMEEEKRDTFENEDLNKLNQKHEILSADHELFKEPSDLNIITESLPLLIGAMNKFGKSYYFNQRMLEYTGLNEKDLLDNKWTFLIYPEDDHKLQILLSKLPILRKEQELELRFRNQAGEYRRFLFKFTPVFGKRNEVLRWYLSAIDIHDQLIAQEQSEARVREFQTINEAIPHMVHITYGDGSSVYINQKLKNYLEVEVSDLNIERWQELIHPEDRESSLQKWLISVANGIPYEGELRLQRYDGVYFWFLGQTIPIFDKQGEVEQWYGTFTDIHHRKLTELQKDDFLNIASHELRTPLAVLQAYLQISERQAEDSLIGSYLKKSLRVLDKLNRLVTGLLEVSRIDINNIYQIALTPFSIGRLIDTVILDYQNITECTFEFSNFTTTQVIGNAEKIEQVLNNLLSNAIKYSPNKSTISIISIDKGNGFVQISIKDKGIGINKTKQKEIFKRFYQVNDSKNTTGLGLGLYITETIIKDHGGEIWVESTPDGGSTFFFTLPIAPTG